MQHVGSSSLTRPPAPARPPEGWPAVLGACLAGEAAPRASVPPSLAPALMAEVCPSRCHPGHGDWLLVLFLP